MQANGKKQITEAVLIAVLSLAATELFQWGMREIKARTTPPKAKNRKSKKKP